MTSLIESDRGRWQAFFVPSPGGAIETATVGFAAKTARRLPDGAGIQTATGDLYTVDGPQSLFDAPDEARVNRRDKAGRVMAIAPVAPPKAFSAGSILERQSMLRPALRDDADLRSAFRPIDAPERAIEVAMNFETNRPAAIGPGRAPAAAAVMVASRADERTAVPHVVGQTIALGYAAPDADKTAVTGVFNNILRGTNGFVPPIGRNDHAWAATPLPPSVFSAKEQTCLATGVYFEARGETALGQAAVAQVILNRVRNPTYPDTICGVVYQNQSWLNRCQFSFACDGHAKRVTNKRAFSTALRIAGEVTRGETWLPEVGSATHYHATYVLPRWASAMRKVDRIGRHVFYRTFGGGWN